MTKAEIRKWLETQICPECEHTSHKNGRKGIQSDLSLDPRGFILCGWCSSKFSLIGRNLIFQDYLSEKNYKLAMKEKKALNQGV